MWFIWFSRIYYDLSEFITIYLNLLRFIWIYYDLSEFITIYYFFFWILSEFLKLKSIFRNILFYF